MDSKIQKKFNDMVAMVGHTPMLKIIFRYKGQERAVYAKAEAYNLTGSIKDRVAFYILQKAYETGEIRPGDLIAEATSGNTGISFSAMGTYLGHPVSIFMPDWMTRERISLMESYGADVKLVSRDEGGFLGSIEKTEALGRKAGVFLPRQFSNEDNVETHYRITALEIAKQLEKMGVRADGVVAGVGTGGTVMGIGRKLRELNPACRVYPLEPLNSPTLSTGYRVGKHRIYGISDEFIPSIVKLSELDQVVSVDDGDAINMARMLCQKLGIGVGVSSGANFIGSIMAQEMQGPQSTIVTVFADDNKKYLSTDYAKPQKVEEHFISKDIELLGVEACR